MSGKRFSSVIIKDGAFDPSAEFFDDRANGPRDSRAGDFNPARGFRDYQVCQGKKVKFFGGKDEQLCKEFCFEESRAAGANTKNFCC